MIGRRIPPGRARISRAHLLTASALLLALAIISAYGASSSPAVVATPVPLVERLGPHTWALAIPAAWIAAPLPGLREGDVIDVVGTRTSERATATEVAVGLRVMSVDEARVVVELTSADAISIAEARARGLSLVPILRSVR